MAEEKSLNPECKDEKGLELVFCKAVMNVLCGEEQVPFKEGVYIKDRSVHPEYSQRDLAVEYLEYVVNNLKFTVPVKVERQVYIQREIVMANFIVTVEGTEFKDQVVIVGAHYDVQNNLSHCWRGSKGDYKVTSGADDNTSGVVGCLALLRRYTKSPPKRTVKIVCFDGEEPGKYVNMTNGSDYFVNSIHEQVDPSASIKSAVIVDMIGAPPTNKHIGLVISASEQVDHIILATQIDELDEGIKISVVKKSSDLNCLNLSDSVHFPKIGVPTVLLCNVAGYADVPDFYHTENDNVGVLDWQSFLQGLDILDFLAKTDMPTKVKAQIKPQPDKVLSLQSMGFSKEMAENALVISKNNVELALEYLIEQ